jgi:hypothetical protein
MNRSILPRQSSVRAGRALTRQMIVLRTRHRSNQFDRRYFALGTQWQLQIRHIHRSNETDSFFGLTHHIESSRLDTRC